MFNEALIKSIMTLFSDFLFRKGFFDFFQVVQREGIEAARRFWHSYPYKNVFFPNALDMYENMIDFYMSLGLAPKAKYDEALKEHEKLHYENTFLRETIMQIQLEMFAEGGEMVREAWKSIIDKQIEMNKEIAKNLFEIFRQGSASLYGKPPEESFNAIDTRREPRHTFVSPGEFVLRGAADKTVKCVILNISDSGLCINSSIPLNKGQKIIVKSSLPIRHKTYTVRWNNVSLTGLSA
jgi:regulator of replication initiation timing